MSGRAKPVLLLALLCANVLLAADAVIIRYSCDEDEGTALRDSGPLGADGTLAASPDTPVTDAVFSPRERNTWYPILRGDVQIKNIKPGSEQLATGGEAPIVLHRGQDYLMDYENGRFKALASGRMETNVEAVGELAYTNSGPQRVIGRQGRAISFDGFDDYVECGQPQGMDALRAIRIELWFRLSGKGGSAPVLIAKGGLAVGFEGGQAVFRHKGLRIAKGKPCEETRSADLPIALDEWHHLKVVHEPGTATIFLDERLVARTENLEGTIDAAGPLRLGGTADPHFFGGSLDDILIAFRAEAPE